MSALQLPVKCSITTAVTKLVRVGDRRVDTVEFERFPVVSPHVVLFCGRATGGKMPDSKLDLLQGTLDVMVLQTLSVLGPQHGYGIARRIEQISGEQILLNQGTIYASLVRLQQRGWITAEWGASDNNRKAKFYSITKRGRKQLADDAAYWERLSGVMRSVFAMKPEGEAQ